MAGWQGLWSNEANSVTGYATPTNNPDLARIRKVLAKPGNRNTATKLQALIGAVAGGAQSRTRRRVAAVTSGNIDSGPRTIETVTELSGVTTAADVTTLKAITLPIVSRPATYPRDLSGNGGPSF